MRRAILLRVGILLGIILLSTGAAYAVKLRYMPRENPDPNHTHADFAVWINGEQWDFARAKYMSAPVDSAPDVVLFNLLTETAVAHDGHEEGDVIPERKYLHLHDGNGSVIHRHKPGLSIRDFFTSIGWQMSNTCMVTDTHEEYCDQGGDSRWRMFVNEREQLMNPHFIFQDGDRILFTYGSPKDVITAQISVQTDLACMYSKTCPWRGEPPTENCIADPAVPCVAL